MTEVLERPVQTDTLHQPAPLVIQLVEAALAEGAMPVFTVKTNPDVKTPLREHLDASAEKILTPQTDEWSRNVISYLRNLHDNVDGLPDDMLQFLMKNRKEVFKLLKKTIRAHQPEYLEKQRILKQLELQYQSLHNSSDVNKKDELAKRIQQLKEEIDSYIPGKTKEYILELAERFMPEKEDNLERLEVKKAEFDSILEIGRSTGRIRLEGAPLPAGQHDAPLGNAESIPDTFKIMRVFCKRDNTWYPFVLPDVTTITHKGGFPRIMLKILAGASDELIDAELPPNDIDVIVTRSDPENHHRALLMGADEAGVEATDNKDLDYEYLLHNRDVDLNAALMSRDGLYYTPAAFEAAKTGKINILESKRSVYGSETFTFEHKYLLCNGRGMLRMMKPVIEGKANAFNILPLNKQVDMGVFMLMLADKLHKKKKGPEMLDKMFYLLKQMGQVKPEEKTIYDALLRQANSHWYFDFNRPEPNMIAVTQWLTGKLLKHVDKAYKREKGMATPWPFEHFAGDDKPETISLENYKPDEQHIQSIAAGWDDFMKHVDQIKHEKQKEAEQEELQIKLLNASQSQLQLAA